MKRPPEGGAKAPGSAASHGLQEWWRRLKADPERYAAMRERWSLKHKGKGKGKGNGARRPPKPYEWHDARWCEPVSLDEIRRAKSRPRGCSEVRWRIELSRRRMEAKFPGRMEALGHLPDPDALP